MKWSDKNEDADNAEEKITRVRVQQWAQACNVPRLLTPQRSVPATESVAVFGSPLKAPANGDPRRLRYDERGASVNHASLIADHHGGITASAFWSFTFFHLFYLSALMTDSWSDLLFVLNVVD